MCCTVDFIVVQHQRYPLLALCVLEQAALRSGIVLKLETCPTEYGPSWLELEGLVHILVERVDGLMRVNISLDSKCNLRLGSEGGIPALVDT